MTSEIETITKSVVDFRDKRDWKKFHNPKELALALSIEVAELNELFLWRKSEDVKPESVEEELADVLIYSILLANECGININKAIENKIIINSKKYPISKSKGNAKKYTDL